MVASSRTYSPRDPDVEGTAKRNAGRELSDPLAPVQALGRRSLSVGAIVGIAGTLTVHGAPAADAVTSLGDLRSFAGHVLQTMHDCLKGELDLDTERPPPPPPPPPEPEPPKEEVVPQKVAPNEPPPPPPAPAQAGKVLTQEADPNEPIDCTGDGFVTGNADAFAGGVTHAAGTATTAVRSVSAVPSGVPGSRGTAPAPPGPPVQDRSRPAMPDMSVGWKDCGFPAEAEIDGIDNATVSIMVTVSAEGRAKSVSVTRDPGHGFGKQARDCAFRKPFVVGLDAAGQPTTKTTPPFVVRFTR